MFAHGVRQNAGADSWKDMKDKAEDRLKALTFSGEGLLTFKNFSDDIRKSFVQLQVVNRQPNMDVTVPTERSLTSSLLRKVDQVKDPTFVARKDAFVRDMDEGKPITFDKVVSSLNTVDPVKKRKKADNSNDDEATASGKRRKKNVTVSSSSSVDIKSGIGDTGVPLRWMPKEEYKLLTDEQVSEHQR